ncbi:MAG: DUF1641 domain-containing protein [Pyrobaculum sp.]
MGRDEVRVMTAEEKLLKALEDPRVQEALLEITERIDVIRDLVVTLKEYKLSGVLDDLLKIAATIRFLTEGLLTRDLIERISKLQEVAFVAGTNLAQDTSKVDCLTHAMAAADASKPVSLMGLLSALRDPEVQRGLGYLISLLKNLGACMREKQ